VRQSDCCEGVCLGAIQIHVGEAAGGGAQDDADVQGFAMGENNIELALGHAPVLPAGLRRPFGLEANRDRLPPATDIGLSCVRAVGGSEVDMVMTNRSAVFAVKVAGIC
jgi:hypothetical protein